MATNFPGSLDSGTQQPSPSAATEMDDVGFEHDVVHTNHSGAIIALETKVGTGDSNAVANSVLAGTGSGTSGWTTGTLANSISGNAATASAVAASALTGATLAAGVTASSLTSVGTLASLNVTGDVGIGTTSPNVPLHLNIGTDNVAILAQSTDGTCRINIMDDSTTGNSYVGIGAVGNNLSLWAGNSRKVTIESGGLVGIGTTSPRAELDVSTATGSNPSTPTEIAITTSSNTTWVDGDVWGKLAFRSADTSGGASAGDIAASISASQASTYGYTTDLSFATRGDSGLSTKMHIDFNGNVGIGTTSPAKLLHLSNATEATIRLDDTGGAVGGAINARVQLYAGGVEAGSMGFPATGGGLMQIENKQGGLYLETDTDHDISLRTNGSTRMTVDGDGRVAIAGLAIASRTFSIRGTTTSFETRNESDVGAGNVTGGIIAIGAAGDNTNPGTGDYWILFRRGNGSTIGSVRGTGSASVNFSTTSDATLKTDNGLVTEERIGSIMDTLQVHNFDWNEGTVTDQIGLFAQEAIDVLPESIVNSPSVEPATADEDETYVAAALDYSKIVPILIAECQFLRARVDVLETV